MWGFGVLGFWGFGGGSGFVGVSVGEELGMLDGAISSFHKSENRMKNK